MAGFNPWGVPKTVSKPVTPRCGSVEKIPPPSLLITMKRQLIASLFTSPVKSCKKERSPSTAIVALWP